VAARAVRNVSAERVVYWGGKAIATYYGAGGLYDSAYAEVRRRPSERRPDPPKTPARKVVTVARDPTANAAPAPAPTLEARREQGHEADSAMVLGTLEELDRKKGA
jgi:hypothetical protein